VVIDAAVGSCADVPRRAALQICDKVDLFDTAERPRNDAAGPCFLGRLLKADLVDPGDIAFRLDVDLLDRRGTLDETQVSRLRCRCASPSVPPNSSWPWASSTETGVSAPTHRSASQ
jgi:hypothetical protein